MSVNGNAGVLFNLTELDVTTATGEVTQVHSVPTAIAELGISGTDLVYSVSGSVGTTAFDFNLNSISNQSGTGYSTQIVRNNSGDITTLKSFVIYNTDSTDDLIVGSSSATNLLTWNSTSDNFHVKPGMAVQFVCGTAITIGSNGLINFKGSAAAVAFELFVFGT